MSIYDVSLEGLPDHHINYLNELYKDKECSKSRKCDLVRYVKFFIRCKKDNKKGVEWINNNFKDVIRLRGGKGIVKEFVKAVAHDHGLRIIDLCRSIQIASIIISNYYNIFEKISGIIFIYSSRVNRLENKKKNEKDYDVYNYYKICYKEDNVDKEVIIRIYQDSHKIGFIKREDLIVIENKDSVVSVVSEV